MKTILVCGSSGFIGGHLCKRLKAEGNFIVGADIRDPKYNQANSFYHFDLRVNALVERIFQENKIDEVYQLAADMGGALYVFSGDNDANIMHNSAQINLNILEACRLHGVKKVFYSSSACIYPKGLQTGASNPSLAEPDAYPANPDSEYGWEKLFSERLYLAYARNYGLNVRIARFHNIYGPEGTFIGGREKAPAAICRKVLETFPYNTIYDDAEIDIIGDGNQTRSFLYIDDCIDAVRLLMESDFKEPINIGSEEMVSINHLAELAISLSGRNISINHIDGPTGVRGRNSDNTLIRKELDWEPVYSLAQGLGKTYKWIESQYGI